MNKSSLVLASVLLIGSASAKEVVYGRDLYSPETHPVTPVVISLADPVQLPRSNYNVTGFRWDIFYGNNFTVTGFDFGLVGHVDGSFTGLALTAASWVEGDATGAELGLLDNVVRGNAVGFQGAGLVNYNHGSLAGFQFALVNIDGTFNGVQFGGLNWDKGVCYGLQLGFANVAVSEFHGWSVGPMNYAERMAGLQFGLVNVVGEMGRGLQIGLFNGAPKYSGIQIGLLNVIGNAAVPVLPVVNGNF
ncbi:MAG: LA_2272 family surface repeat-containing protein [Kiritimatiellia bacterium]